MSETENVQPVVSSLEGSSLPPVDPGIEEILRGARSGMAAIAELAESAKISAAAVSESQRLTAMALADSQMKLADITTTATQAVASRTKITDEQAIIATKSDHIQKAQEHADKVRENLDRALTSATQQATEAEGQKSRAQSVADSATELLANIRTAKGVVETDAGAVALARKASEESATLTKGLADKSVTVEERIASYEKRLVGLDAQCIAQLKTIEGLLPGATTAGLASAFDDRRKTFLKPQNWWQWVFLGSVLAIVGLAVTGLWHVYQSGSAPTYGELLRLWLSRLPVAGALVWLALHASRESALAKRLEEDYGYKSVIASSFLGFHKQMLEVGMAAASNAPLAKLCGDTLATIASPPGRIYAQHKLTVSPTEEVAETARAVAEILKTQRPGPSL